MVEPVSATRVIRATVVLAVPAGVVLLALVGYAGLAVPHALIAFIALTAAFAGIAYRHARALEAVRRRIEALARDEKLRGEAPTSSFGLAEAVAELDRTWSRSREALHSASSANAAILEAIPSPLILVDARRRVTRANTAARALFGEALAGRDLDTVLRHPDVLETADEYLAGRPGAATLEIAWPGPPDRHFAVRFAPLPGTGDAAGFLLVLHDVTALKQAERMRADFVANVSHELRTPLSALLGFTETLRGPARDDAPARERFLGIMQEQAQRMTRLVRDLLSLSRIEELEHTPPTEAVDIRRIVGSVVDTLALQAKAKTVSVEVDIAADVPAVTGDADQLAQVLQNLLDNAIKYARTGGQVRIAARKLAGAPPRVAASAARARGQPAPPHWISIAVADDGEGIAREHLPRLTERFYRVDAARSRQLGGTGLGLAIVKHILNRHRGGVVIESEPGRGSVFTVWLPGTSP